MEPTTATTYPTRRDAAAAFLAPAIASVGADPLDYDLTVAAHAVFAYSPTLGGYVLDVDDLDLWDAVSATERTRTMLLDAAAAAIGVDAKGDLASEVLLAADQAVTVEAGGQLNAWASPFRPLVKKLAADYLDGTVPTKETPR